MSHFHGNKYSPYSFEMIDLFYYRFIIKYKRIICILKINQTYPNLLILITWFKLYEKMLNS